MAVVVLILATLILRYMSFANEALVNLAPVAAMALCFGLFAKRLLLGIALAVATLFLSDVMITALSVQRDPTLSFWALLFSPAIALRYALYGAFLGLAWALRQRQSAGLALGLAPLASLGFYAVMNTVAWAMSAPPFAYAKTLAGWWQSQTVGLPIPGAPPSYVFLRNAMIGDLLFTLLFLALMVWLPKRQASGEVKQPLEDAHGVA